MYVVATNTLLKRQFFCGGTVVALGVSLHACYSGLHDKVLISTVSVDRGVKCGGI